MRMERQNMRVCPIIQSKLNQNLHDDIQVIISLKSPNALSSCEISSLSKDIKYELPIINGYACSMNLDTIKRINNSSKIDYIYYDAPVYASLDIAGKTIGVERAYDLGLTGKDITIATVDTGVAPHRDLTHPTNRIIGFRDFMKNYSRPYDDNGHGTHVAGILASNGWASKGKYRGIAPEANIVTAKVLDENGNGKTSDILSAIQWIISTKDIYNTRILNMSLGTSPIYREKKDPLVKAANKAIESGLIVTAAVGNSGPEPKSILSPATSRMVISVGALDDNRTVDKSDDFLPSFSSRGPTIDRVRKPDLIAPGVDIMSLSSKDNSGYVSLTGTSMASPFVSGAIALLLEKDPSLTHFEVKKILTESCSKIQATQLEQGAGVLNLEKLFK